ncbi:MAG: glycosyltransferase family 39 protein, partial [Candidatus Omnitrophica bacterium]|nr:glycosyltransferase family 39 protein [Candidatus Omnitrophota bacterium]
MIPNRIEKVSWIIAGGLLVVFAGALLALGVAAHTDPTEMDTTAYLTAAFHVRDTGGIPAHVANCFRGVYWPATQHPLYLLLISPVAEHSIEFFVKAKWLSAVGGVLSLAAVFWAAWRLWGMLEAFLAVMFMASGATFLRLSTMVACEAFLAAAFVGFFLMACRGFEPGRSRAWWWAGLWASAAFLTKSLGILALGIFGISALWIYRRNLRGLFGNKAFWIFFLAFLIPATPLLARNIRVHGQPLYSDSSAVLWVDRYTDYTPEKAAAGLIGIGPYLKTHSVRRIAATLWAGLEDRNPRMLIDGLKPFRFWAPVDLSTLTGFHKKTVPWQGPWALGILVLAAAGLWRCRRTPAAVVGVVSIGIFYVFVAWYSKIYHSSPPTRIL